MTNPADLSVTERRRRHGVLARADTAALREHWARFAARMPCTPLRAAQTGMVMLRGCIQGDGAPFNFGEATVSRATVRAQTGPLGVGVVLGRDREKAELVARFDAASQITQLADEIERDVIGPLARAQQQARASLLAQTAASRVEFFTLVRGET
jgi:alpha-D-ribose 1-methylphosphonate 5-triphosphate synthase subunit PhnG